MIAVVTLGDPTTVEAALRLNTYGVIPTPVKSFGLLSAIAVTLNQVEKCSERDKYVARLEQRLAAQRKVNKAKTILMQKTQHHRGGCLQIDPQFRDEPALDHRGDRRAVIRANETLGLDAKQSV